MKEILIRESVLTMMVCILCLLSSLIRKRLKMWIKGCDGKCHVCAFDCNGKGLKDKNLSV